MITASEKRELLELLGALCNETISEDRALRLSQLLERGPEFRQFYFRYLEIDQRLSTWAGAESHAQPLAGLKRELDRIAPDVKSSQIGLWSWIGRAAAAATIAAVSIGLWRSWQDDAKPLARHRPVERQEKQPIADEASSESPGVNIRTLLRSADCEWEPGYEPKFNGPRLLSLEFRVKSGIIDVTLETGVRLVVEGPAALSMKSNRRALLAYGRVVLHGDEMADEFALETPEGTLFDVGTEYGASVNEQGETMVRVFTGKVRFEPRDGAIDNRRIELLPGRRTGRLNSDGLDLQPLAVRDFVRRIPESSLPRLEAGSDQLAYEGFEYPIGRLGNGNGGQGWAGPWKSDILGDAPPRVANITAIPSRKTGRLQPAMVDRCMRHDGKGSAWRKLATPVRLDVNAVYYMSCFMQKNRGAPPDITQYGSVSLRSRKEGEGESRILFGMISDCCPGLTHREQQLITAPPLSLKTSYFYVAKIIADQSGPDQVMMRVYGPDESLSSREPETWTCVSRPDYDDSVYDWVLIYFGGDAEYLIDELRIGSTWESVCGPRQ